MSGYSNEYISAIIKDSDGEGLYYGILKSNSTSNDEGGPMEITLPDLDEGEYTLIILNEQINPAYKTNYAGYDIVELTISNDQTPPTATNIYARTPNDGKTHITLTATDEEIGLWKVVATKNAAAEPLAIFLGDKSTQTIRFSVDGTSIQSVCVVDKAGNVSDPLPLYIDNSLPIGTIGYISAAPETQE